MNTDTTIKIHNVACIKGKLVGQKMPLKLKEIWAIRIRLQLAKQVRELAMFNLAIDSKLRGCDLVDLQVRDVAQGGKVLQRAINLQRKTRRPVQFEITEQIHSIKQRAILSRLGVETASNSFHPGM